MLCWGKIVTALCKNFVCLARPDVSNLIIGANVDKLDAHVVRPYSCRDERHYIAVLELHPGYLRRLDGDLER